MILDRRPPPAVTPGPRSSKPAGGHSGFSFARRTTRRAMPGTARGRPGFAPLARVVFSSPPARGARPAASPAPRGKTSAERLRELARQAGVSHAAPRRHFADRQALLDALAEAGFLRLGDELRAAIRTAGDDYKTRLRRPRDCVHTLRDGGRRPPRADVCRQAWPALRGAGRRVRPPVHHVRRPDPPGAAGRRATARRHRPGPPAALRRHPGHRALVTSGSVNAGQTDELIADTVALFAHGPR